MSTCAKCDYGFTSSDVIAVCNVCNDLFHANSTGKNCANCSASEIKVLEFKKKKAMMVYRCPTCTLSGGEDASLKALVVDLQKSIKELSSFKEEIKSIKECIPGLRQDIGVLKATTEECMARISNVEARIKENEDSSDVCKVKITKLENIIKEIPNSNNATVDQSEAAVNIQVLSELEDRRSRENNLIILNVPDSDGVNPEIDAVAVEKALVKIKNLKTKFSKTNIRRLGKFNHNKCRPILVKMDNRLDVTSVLINWKLVEDGINVSADLTKYQRSVFKNLKQKAKDFNNAHINDTAKQIVKMVHGDPKLITIKDKHHVGSSTASKSSIHQKSKNL